MTTLLLVVASQVVLRPATAAARRWSLRSRAELTRAVAELPPGAEVVAAGPACRTRSSPGRSSA